MSDARFTLAAFAKVNLMLRVVGRRADDYHEIQTVFQTISLHDRLTFEALEDERLELASSAPDVPLDASNLVLRAAAALRERFQVRRGARIELEKRIPVEGGLGGGSSDAAVALLGLAHLWGVAPGRHELAEMGAQLGADVPFFFTGGTALGTGLGTEITPLEDAPVRHLLIVTPGAKVSTAEAYRALGAPALTKADGPVMLPISCADAQISDSLYGRMQNDFEPVIFRLRPEIERARNMLLEVGAQRALLAGSGASVFGIFDSQGEVGRARRKLAAEARWRVVACMTLTRAEYRGALGACAALL